MSEVKYLETSKSYLLCQLKRYKEQKGISSKEPLLPFVTISRETGAGGTTVAKYLIDYLTAKDSDVKCPWSLFDKNLIRKVLEDHNLQPVIEKLLPEDKFSEIQEVFEELFGLHPTRRELIFKMSNSIQKLAEMGNCVIVGRGANLITHKLGNGFHVRIIGTKPKRILHLQEYYGMEKKQAEEYIQSEDKARREFVKKIYGADPDDSHLYDIIINTDNISYNDAAEIIGSRVIALKKKLLIKFRR